MTRLTFQSVSGLAAFAITAALFAASGDAFAADAPPRTPAKSKKKAQPFRWVNPVPASVRDLVSHSKFASKLAGEDVGYTILLPPGYDAPANADQRYATVYYLHGGRPGSEAKGANLAKYIHSAMESGRIPPMIYVFPNGGPVSHYNVPARPEAIGKDVFIEELIPHIDATYRTMADREHRGLEGFSQGGRGTARIGFRHPELFCSIAPGGGGHATEKRISESGGEENPNLVFAEGDNTYDLARKYAATTPREPVSVLVYVGTKGFNYENNLAYMKFLDTLNVPYERLIVDGVPHSASKIYEKAGEQIMQFHAKNFGLLPR